MELVNEFRVAVPIRQAWDILTDLERIAPCMPGAQLQSVEGEDYLGAVKVKVGPIVAQYKGKATFQERDEQARRAVIKADGRETRGQGNANALITAQLTEEADGTKVVVSTDLTITGKAAQFGRGVLADVSGKLLQQFVQCLEADLLATGAAPAGEPAAESVAEPAPGGPAPRADETARPLPAAAEPVDVLGVAAGPVAKRLAPVLAVLIVLAWVLRRRAKARRRRSQDS